MSRLDLVDPERIAGITSTNDVAGRTPRAQIESRSNDHKVAARYKSEGHNHRSHPRGLDAELLDEVLESPDAMRRIETMPVLVGLLEPVGRGESVAWQLHPLIREHC